MGELRASDWQGKLLSFDDLAGYEGAGESLIVQTKTAAEAQVAAGMIKGAALKSSFLVLYPSDKGDQRVPFWKGSEVTMRPVVWDTWSHGVTPLPTLKGSKAVRTLKTEATVVVRVLVVQEITAKAEWQAARQGFRSYVMGKLAVADAWGAAEEERMGNTIVGLARAKACNLVGLMAKSGMDGVFVEPVGRTGNGPSYGVRWEEQKVGENRADYFKRVLALRDKAGIVVGRRQLGVRPEDQMRSWRLTGAPKHWSTDTVTEVLEGAGLQNIALSSRLLRRSACSWFFRAKGTEECVHVPVKDGEATFDLYILPATVATRAPGARQPLRPERAQQFTKEKFATTVEPQRDMETTDDGKEQPGGKRRAQEVRELPSGVRLEKQPADGNCLAHCLGTGLTWLKGDQKKRPARLVRSELYTFLKGQADNFAPFWDGRNCGDELAPNMTFAEYLAEMSMEGKYLGCLELEAASKAFRVTIVVIPTDAGIPPTRHGHYDRLLALWYSGKHYDLLLPATGQDSYPAAITGVQAFGEKSGGRGGGADSEAEEAERLTVYTASSAPQAGATRARRQLKRQPSHDSVATHITLFSLWGGAKRGRPEPERARLVPWTTSSAPVCPTRVRSGTTRRASRRALRTTLSSRVLSPRVRSRTIGRASRLPARTAPCIPVNRYGACTATTRRASKPIVWLALLTQVSSPRAGVTTTMRSTPRLAWRTCSVRYWNLLSHPQNQTAATVEQGTSGGAKNVAGTLGTPLNGASSRPTTSANFIRSCEMNWDLSRRL